MSLRQLGRDLPILWFCRKTVGEEVLETEVVWENDEEVFLNVAQIIDED
jgi:hypothetical protein